AEDGIRDRTVTGVQTCALPIFKKIAALNTLAVDRKAGLQVGCLVRLDEIARDAGVLQLYPALARAIADAASPQIRNMATIGGNRSEERRVGKGVDLGGGLSLSK